MLLVFDPAAAPAGVPLTLVLLLSAGIAATFAGLAWRRASVAAPAASPPPDRDPTGSAPQWDETAWDGRLGLTTAGAAPWDESALREKGDAAPPRAPIGTTGATPDEVEIALQEIARIEAELEVRPTRSRPLAAVPARS